MATRSLHPGSAPANPIVAAYLAARANEAHLDQSDLPTDSFEMRMAQFVEAGARNYVTAWGIQSAEHGALVALLTADRLRGLIEGFATYNVRKQRVVTFGIEELNEVREIRHSLVNLWRHLDSNRSPALRSLAYDLGLIDDDGNHADPQTEKSSCF